MELDFSNIKPSVLNLAIIFVSVAVTVPLMKVIFNRYPVPGVTALVNSI